jgi:predicted RNase H-like nuclease
MRVLGVDGCPGGWIGAVVTWRGQVAAAVEWVLLPGAAAVVELAATVEATGIDIPIGLPDAAPRACDMQARAALGPRRSSVFPAPVRAVLAAADYPDACERSRAASGKALSQQAWRIVGKVRDVDDAMTPALQARIVEVHPELAFARMTGAVLASKRTQPGEDARVAALASWLPEAAATLRAAPRPARHDDAADALACAWSAARWARGDAVVVPERAERDARGLRMEIVS